MSPSAHTTEINGTWTATTVASRPDIELRSDIVVRLLDHSAADDNVARTARVSTTGTSSHTEDYGDKATAGLIRYLMKSRHGSPFEHNVMTFLVEAPIFTVRHLMRHRTWSFNEESARYRELRPIFYLPDRGRLLSQEGKPGHYRYVPGQAGAYEKLTAVARQAYSCAYDGYTDLLDAGIAREVARMVLPTATYSTVYATCNARSLMHFLSLRTQREDATYPSAPQREIEIVAEKMEEEWSRLMPVTHAAFEDFGRVSP